MNSTCGFFKPANYGNASETFRGQFPWISAVLFSDLFGGREYGDMPAGTSFGIDSELT